MQSIANAPRVVLRSDATWEQVVFAEVLVPGVANVFGDFWTEANIREAAYLFMAQGFGIDVEHDNVDVLDNKAHVVESFIVRDGDPDFIKGSWVVAMRITDSMLWLDILEGRINGYSYQAVVSFLSAVIEVDDDGVRTGITEPDPEDGHTHYFMTIVDSDNRPTGGGTSEDYGHSHTISTHTVTDEADGHVHRYNLVVGKDGK